MAAIDETVLITGFGPFGDIALNPSWEVVRKLVHTQPLIEVGGCKYLLHAPTDPVPVTYRAIDDAAAAGNHYNVDLKPSPCLIIHVGVGREGNVRLETQACNEGYCMPDCDGVYHPAQGICAPDAPQLLHTCLDVPRIITQVGSHSRVKVAASEDAGRYLCEYMFFKSLYFSQVQRTKAGCPLSGGPEVLFVHIPPFDRPYSHEQLTDLLYEVVRASLSQLQERTARINELASLTCSRVREAEVLLSAHETLEAAAEAYLTDPETAIASAQSQLGISAAATFGKGAETDIDTNLFRLVNMGFEECVARAALQASNGDLQEAAMVLADQERS